MTVIGITEFFKTGKGVDLEVITSATLSKLEEIKEKTATGNPLLISLHLHRDMVTLRKRMSVVICNMFPLSLSEPRLVSHY